MAKAQRKPKLEEGDLQITVNLLFPNHHRGGAPRQFDIVCNPETMTVQLEEDLVAVTEELDPNENPEAAAQVIIDAIKKEGVPIDDDMKPHFSRLLTAVIGATP